VAYPGRVLALLALVFCYFFFLFLLFSFLWLFMSFGSLALLGFHLDFVFLGGLNGDGRFPMARLTAWTMFNHSIAPAPASPWTPRQAFIFGKVVTKPSAWTYRARRLPMARLTAWTMFHRHVARTTPLLVVNARRNFSNPLGVERCHFIAPRVVTSSPPG
jgi:hypothetical protein